MCLTANKDNEINRKIQNLTLKERKNSNHKLLNKIVLSEMKNFWNSKLFR